MNIQGIKLLLVEDSSVLVERMAELILDIPEIELIRVVDSEVAALTELRKRPIHIVVLDLQLKVGTGFGILRSMSTLTHKPRTIVLTNYDSADYEGHAITLGATLFLDKAHDFPRMPQILAQIVEEIRSE